jgi:hypothetical protein
LQQLCGRFGLERVEAAGLSLLMVALTFLFDWWKFGYQENRGDICNLLLCSIVQPHFQHIAILVNSVTVLICAGRFKAHFATADAAKRGA